jgi:hypothetical protein
MKSWPGERALCFVLPCEMLLATSLAWTSENSTTSWSRPSAVVGTVMPEDYICYECREGNHEWCWQDVDPYGEPCECGCPINNEDGMEMLMLCTTVLQNSDLPDLVFVGTFYLDG